MAKYTLRQQAASHANAENAFNLAEQEIRQKNLVDEPIIEGRQFKQANGVSTPNYNVFSKRNNENATSAPADQARTFTKTPQTSISGMKTAPKYAPRQQTKAKKQNRYQFNATDEASKRYGKDIIDSTYGKKSHEKKQFVESDANFKTLAHILSIPKNQRTAEQNEYLYLNKDNDKFAKYAEDFLYQFGEERGKYEF